MRCAGILLFLLLFVHLPVTAQERANQASPLGDVGVGHRLLSAVDIPGFCCPDYLVLITDRIRVNWSGRVPAAGTTVLKVTIRRDGRITDSSVETSSGYNARRRGTARARTDARVATAA
jgi:hypothetical protein